ncbi:hypothetical protein NLU13_8717 [Sarocladium strictum]|uniref:Uncharacterized protein n=1 Tax=Sarocladium strictum TaxID=5046 RepID=A0AA39L4W9_SARSR|nr:hypothetical protein NLU13_8717 [Sarocladium strictum]
MTSSSKSQTSTTTVLLFGDQTDSWEDGLDQLYSKAASTPWLQSFLDTLSDLIPQEAKAIRIDVALKHSLGHFSSLAELSERYRRGSGEDDNLGVVRCLLLHALLSSVAAAPSEWIGISGGLVSLSALAMATDLSSLAEACLEIARLLVRLCKLTSERSRAVEDQPGVWGWAILGIPAPELRGTPPMKRAKVGVAGPGWNTVIGPPSVLKLFIEQCPAIQGLAKNPLEIKALQHTLNTSDADINFIVGDNAVFLDKPLTRRPGDAHGNALRIWGMDEPAAVYPSRRHLLRAVCVQLLSRPLDIPVVVDQLRTKLDGDGCTSVRIIQMGASSHASYLAKALRTGSNSRSISTSQTGRIAIVGMAGRGPGSDNVDEFWKLIMDKQDLCSEVPADRFNCTMTTRYGCFMEKPGNFDARFFHISPREAMLMDPGHRLFLMSTYEALEMAGYSDGPTRSTDPNRIAAFFGQCTDDWHDAAHQTLGCDAYTLQGVQRAFGPGRLAWHFKWEGPTYSFDSACASSTVSIHLACMSLLARDVDMAVAGAANILSYPHSFTCLSKSGVLSDTGNCKPFRDDADGYCRGDFVGAVVLKRLEDAIAHNDNILAVVAGSGRNHSGNSTSITTSDAGAQQRLFRKVMRRAQVAPEDISYVEMHGTGTQVGDPAEMAAVTETFAARRRRQVKGQDEEALRPLRLLKCLMMFQTDTIPPQPGMPHALNPRFPSLEEAGIEIPAEPVPWPKPSSSLRKPRRILLNNFDAAGGNACMILEEFISPLGPQRSSTEPMVVVSGRTPAAFQANKRKLVEWLQASADKETTRIEDIAYTTTARRMHHQFRFACTASTVEELAGKITASMESPPPAPGPPSPIVMVFTGQGSHYAGMGKELYYSSPYFRETVDLCVDLSRQHGFPPFLDIILDANEAGGEDVVDVSARSAVQTQLAVLTLKISLASLRKSSGVLPSLVVGHSPGEYAALCVSGVLSVADVLYLVGQRALLIMERCEADSCAMLSVPMSVRDTRAFLDARPQYSSTCGVACINGPATTVLSGGIDDIARLQDELSAQSTHARALAVPYGFHSAQMDPLLGDYAALAGGVTFSSPKIPVASTLLSTVIDTAGTFNASYLARQTREPVAFVGPLQAIRKKLQDPILWLEVGPSAVCGSFVRSTLYPRSSSSAETAIVSSLQAPQRGVQAWESIATCLVAAYTHGVDVDWLAHHGPYADSLELLRLPTYAWDLKDYWVSYTDIQENASLSHAPKTVHQQQPISTCAQFVVSESSSPGDIRVTLQASLSDPGLSALIDGHRMQNEPICPGSVFCEAAIAASSYMLEANGRKGDTATGKLALRNPVMSRALTKHLVDADGYLSTTVSMKSASSQEIQVSWKAASAESPGARGQQYSLGTCSLAVCESVESLQSAWDRTSYFIKTRMDDIIRSAKAGLGHRFRPDIFYALFGVKVQYDASYKGIKEAFVSDDYLESAAQVVLPSDPVGTRFAASPYWGEISANLAGFTVNTNPQLSQGNEAGTSFINSGFTSFEQTVAFVAGASYFTYVRVSEIDKDTRSCDIFIFDDTDRLVAQCIALGFRRVRNDFLRQMLSGKSKPSLKTQADATPSATHRQSGAVAVPPEARPVEAPHEPQIKTSATGISAEAKGNTPGAFDVLLESIAKETGMDVSELTDDVKPAELGVDSIMAIEVTSTVTTATGLELTPTFLIEHTTIGDLRRSLDALDPSRSSSRPSPSSSDLSSAPPVASSSSSSSNRNDGNDDGGQSTSPGSISTPSSPASTSLNDFVVVEDQTHSSVSATAEAKATTAQPMSGAREKHGKSPWAAVGGSQSPQPSVRLTLLKSQASASTQPPFYFIADGTGSIGSYIHIPAHIRSAMRLCGIDSPYLRCPDRLTVDVGIPGAARPIVEAMVKKQQPGVPFWVGGFSGGAMIAYEVARQLAAAGHVVEGLLLIDMCSPRTESIPVKGDLGLAMFDAISRRDDSGVWSLTTSTQRHLQALFASVAAYHPTPLLHGEVPPAKRTALIWAQKGMIDRSEGDPRLMKLLEEQGIPTEAYPGFMEDPKLGAVGWSLAHKTEADLGPNGWDRYVGKDRLLCSYIEGDHLDLPTPKFAHLLGQAMEDGFAFFRQG